jgi:glycosyltransferase involved in cell wall biosynthesis
VACSNTSSLPEVAGQAALLFNPQNPQEIHAALKRLATEPELRSMLRTRGLEQTRRFSWAETARLTWQAYQDFLEGTRI